MNTPAATPSSDPRVAPDAIVETVEWVDVLRGGDRIRIRQIHADDKPMVRVFIEGLSQESRRFRFRDSMRSPDEALLRLLTEIDPRRDLAYVAVVDDLAGDLEVGVARFSAAANGQDCEFAVVVGDRWQRKGVATHLMRHLVDAARRRGIREMHSSDASDNHLMRRFATHLRLSHAADPLDAGQIVYRIGVVAAAETPDRQPHRG
ncbi:GNAT family N-acetyltransferase [Xylophilus sp. Kf1]|nr:GNAT family N-acetyltransferase [Xylophilus sp. Kf1]